MFGAVDHSKTIFVFQFHFILFFLFLFVCFSAMLFLVMLTLFGAKAVFCLNYCYLLVLIN